LVTRNGVLVVEPVVERGLAHTCQQPGQYTTLFGAGAVAEGNVHFAGEHTSLEDFGYLNGAVETGERAARAIAG
jgi:monoamine oxidase